MTFTGAIDRWLPHWNVRERHSTIIRAPAAGVWAALHATDLTSSRLVRALFGLRGLGVRGPVVMDSLQRRGFVLLESAEPHHVVLGLIGRPWSPRGSLIRVLPEQFRTFAEQDYVRVAWSFSIEEVGQESLLRTETRVAATDDRARRLFAMYWWFIGPFSSLIRRRMLRAIARHALASR